MRYWDTTNTGSVPTTNTAGTTSSGMTTTNNSQTTTNSIHHQQQQQHHHSASISSRPIHNNNNANNYYLKCTDLPQFDACQAQADLFRSDDKLHLRYLCNDTARCASLIAIHTSRPSYSLMKQNYYCNNNNGNNTDTGTTVDAQQRVNIKPVTSTSSTTTTTTTTTAVSPTQYTIRKIVLDYSRQRVTGETMEQLFDLADAVGLNVRCKSFAYGYNINITEQKPVLHHILRMPSYYNIELVTDHHTTTAASQNIDSTSNSSSGTPTNTGPTRHDGQAILQDIHKTRSCIQDFAYRVRCGEYYSILGPEYTLNDVVVIATGGAHVGAECVAEAMKADPIASKAAGLNRHLTFVSHADPTSVYLAVRNFHPQHTLIIVISESFNASENPVMLNARTVIYDWLVPGIQKCDTIKSYTSKDIISQHVLAVTQNTSSAVQCCTEFGISLSNIYTIPTWVNFRYSVCSAVGLLPLSLQYSYPVMSEFLDGAHDIDEHFFHAPLRDNIPVILGLLGVWNSTFLGYGCRAILPFSHSLHRFPAYVQHVDMESNGKRVAIDGTPLLHQSGEITFGGTGGPHNYIQLLHQGRVVPTDFIGFIESQQPTELQGEVLSNHDDMMANFFAQPDGLAYGKTLVDLIQDGVAEPLREHMVLSGNRPSSSLLLTKLDAYAMGQLIAIYEHRTAVQGFIWGINSFDRFGTDLGVVLAKQIRAQISASRKTGASVQGFNASTSTLLEHFLSGGSPKNR